MKLRSDSKSLRLIGYSTAEVTNITAPASEPKATSGGTPTTTAAKALYVSP